jgi:hypothetical protein
MAARSVSRRGRPWAWLLAAGVVAAAVRASGAAGDLGAVPPTSAARGWLG